MNKDELIAKQQLEIESLKQEIEEMKSCIHKARDSAIHVQQWSTKCSDFPKVAMNSSIYIADVLNA